MKPVDEFIHLYSECRMEYNKLSFEEMMQMEEHLLKEERKAKVRLLAVGRL